MRKLCKAGAFVAFVYVVPLLSAPNQLLRLPLLIAMIGALLLILAQPDLRWRDASTNRRTDRGSALSILLAGVVAHLFAVIEWKMHEFPPLRGGLALDQVLGAALLAGGLAFRIASIRMLGGAFTATVQVRQGQRLVTHGPYARVRHPSYLGALVAIVGHALVLQAYMAAIAAAVVMLLAYRYRTEVEEATLRKTFGTEYESYARKTKRMIPLVW